MNKIIHLRKRTKQPKVEDAGGALQVPKQARYEQVANTNTDKLKKMLKDLQIEASGGSVKKSKTFTL